MRVLNIFRKKQPDARAAVIGFDGLPVALVRDLCKQGRLPTLAALLKEGPLCEMATSVPPVSPVSWTTCFTGVNPGRHGIFGIAERRRDSYGIYFPNALQIQSPALWDILGNHAKTTVAVNIPQTYPAREMKGILISGYVALNLERAVYPDKLVSALQEIDYRIDIDLQQAAGSKEAALQELLYILKKRRETFGYLLDRVPWDLFFGVFTGPGRLLQLCPEECRDPETELYPLVLQYFSELDDALAEMIAKLDANTALILLSNHGTAGLEKEVFLNTWLQQQGLLRFKEPAAVSLEEIDPDRTRAFALDPGRIYINLEGALPRGCVAPGSEYEELAGRLKAALSELKDEETGEVPVRRIFTRQELYTGPLAQKAADLVLEASPGYALSGLVAGPGSAVIGRPESASGAFAAGNAFFYMRGMKNAPDAINIRDVAPTVLKLLKLSVPQEMDGRALI